MTKQLNNKLIDAKVSVIAVCYNHESYLLETLDSIVAQTYADIQLIIMDDNSTDNSVDIISEWIVKSGKQYLFIPHTKNCGICATLNEALKLCDGEFVQIIACDDILQPEKIAFQVTALKKSSTSALACSDFTMIDSNSEIIASNHYADDYQFPEDPFIAILDGSSGYKRVIHSPTVLLRKSIIDEIGGWPEDLIQEDFYMWSQITFRYPVIFNNIPLVQYRVLESSLSSSLTNGSGLTQIYLQDQIKVIENFLQKTQGLRQQIVKQEIQKRIEKLELFLITNSEDIKSLQNHLTKWLNYRKNLFAGNLKSASLYKSVGKTIYNLWVAGLPDLYLYKPYYAGIAMKYRILMSLGIKFSTIQKIKTLLNKK